MTQTNFRCTRPTFGTKIATALLALSVTLAAPSAHASTTNSNQYLGGNITREYTAADLTTRYGILDIAVGEIWVITFPDTVMDHITSREGVLQFSKVGNRLFIGALASTGSYPIVIPAGDRVYFFQARLAPNRGGGIRNVIVRGDEPPSPEQAIPGFPAAAAAPVGEVPTPTQVTVRTASTSTALPQVPIRAPLTVPPAAAAQPAVSAPPALTPPAPIPLKLDLQAFSDGVTTRVYYRATNPTTQPVTFQEQDFHLSVTGVPLPYTPTQATVTVPPAGNVTGELHLPLPLTSLTVSLLSPDLAPTAPSTLAVTRLK